MSNYDIFLICPQTDVKVWTLADMIDDEQYEMLLQEAKRALQPFVKPDGSIEFASIGLKSDA